MRMGPADVIWTKENAKGDDNPLARTQHVALTVSKSGDRVFLFGGHHSPKARLNDTWILNVKELEWNRIGKENNNLTNQDSSIGAPAPRANAGACFYDSEFGKKVYVMGGHGGVNYARLAFNDLFSFDIETETWEKLEGINNAPEGRGGHSLFPNNGKLYVYGGWNCEMQYTNICIFDLEKKEWSDPDIFNGIPRWNHSGILVEAIPTWKYFIFGGECLEYNEGAQRSFGAYVNSSCYLDLGTDKWTTYASNPEQFANMPSAREYSAMSYDQKSKLILYGGWNNGWYDDLYTLNVAKIVGPSYAIISSDPALGQVSGGDELVIKGRGFQDQNIRVFFTCGEKPVDNPTKQTIEVPGVYVDETTITCIT